MYIIISIQNSIALLMIIITLFIFHLVEILMLVFDLLKKKLLVLLNERINRNIIYTTGRFSGHI